MPINNITQTVSTIPAPPHRGVDVQTQFVIKQEDFQDHLQGTTVAELNTLKTQINTTVTGMNIAVETVNTKASEASASASSASTSADTATTKASQAFSSASNANVYSTKASQWADNNYNVAVETGKYSAKHWSTVAQNATANKVDKVTSTDNAVVRFNGTTGEVQNSGVIIDDRGNIGVGITPSAWAIGASIDIATNGAIFGDGQDYTWDCGIVQNGYQTSAGVWQYKSIATQTAGMYRIDGNQHEWRAAPKGAAGNPITWTKQMQLDPIGNLLLTSGTGGIGYGAGSGGTVTQLTSKSTAVTLNKPSGIITTHDAALASGATAEFILNNSLMVAETISVLHNYPSIYDIRWGIDTSGKIRFIIKNISASSWSHVITIYFSIIKGAVS